MRKLALSLILAIHAFYSIGQKGSFDPDSTYFKPGWANMDLSVPESPAFKILGTDPSSIMHPSSVKNIALSVGNYFISSGPVLPKSLAVQFCPYLLANNNNSLNSYQKNKFWDRLSLSIGTNVQGNSYSAAEGINMTIIDNTDLKANKKYLGYLDTLSTRIAQTFDRAKSIYRLTVDSSRSIVEIDEALATDTADTSPLYRCIDSIASVLSGISDNVIINYRNNFKTNNWNASIWQIGLAVLQTSSDSLVKNLQVKQYGLWSSTGLPVFGTKGQFLLGFKVAYADSITWQWNYSAGARLYYGGNNFKGFFQGEYDYTNKINNLVLTVGCQFNIFNGTWGQFALNVIVDGTGKISWQPGFNIGLGTGEKKTSHG